MKKIKTLGIVGGNLTSALLCIEAKKRDIKTILLEKEIDNIASNYASQQIVGELNTESITRLNLRTDAIVFLTNNIYKLEPVHGSCFPTEETLNQILSRIEQVRMAQQLKIPVPIFCIDQPAEFEFPYECHATSETEYKHGKVENISELETFLDFGNYQEILIEKIEEYKQSITITALKQSNDEIVFYPIAIEGDVEGDVQSYIKTPANLNKTNTKKILGYVKKILKYLPSIGMFTFKFGIKEDKNIEFLSINPGISVGDIQSNHYTNLSVYEQFLNLIEGKGIAEPILYEENCVYITHQNDSINDLALPYHVYNFDSKYETAIKIYVMPKKN
ncbi:hypothetical protein AN639_05810 [Candidatus Epulonipiscium fishelsonii]|uniref:Uncharacterized protein n=1 Tax=Candidatus Epulonipiscium fishelsonii TaxID=77094 RepID=A0ACC8X8M7_9FIRM|nr:hypothetical protein AN396_11645 [Epulopiscium sp. SCG-B11WGA-EpuloA1]ONI39727.1 hypothetical protein AN639_05810 [Epulopiscium sp. SCG-B05WGA-EpuloA1]